MPGQLIQGHLRVANEEQGTLNKLLPVAAWKIKAPANDESTSLLVGRPLLWFEARLNSKLSMNVKKLACTRVPNQTPVFPHVIAD